MADALQIFKEALIAKRAADQAAAKKTPKPRSSAGAALTASPVNSSSDDRRDRQQRLLGVLPVGGVRRTVVGNGPPVRRELSTTVASASEEASTNVQAVASATEELSSSVNEISRQVQEFPARMAGNAVDQARSTTERVGELSKAVMTRIGDVVELINTSSQGKSTCLALNATIEAARAGEAGSRLCRGRFEVEVPLAEQMAKATWRDRPADQRHPGRDPGPVNAIKDISGTIEKLSEISSAIAAAVEEQGAATCEISRNVIQQAAQGTQQVSSNVTDVQRGATETGTASSEVLAAAKTLVD